MADYRAAKREIHSIVAKIIESTIDVGPDWLVPEEDGGEKGLSLADAERRRKAIAEIRDRHYEMARM